MLGINNFNTSERNNCLIGKTGYVGSALLRQATFRQCYNRSNIDEIAGKTFPTVICAAAPGSMIEANRSPERDRAQIQALMDMLATIHCERFVLISSIAVLADFAGGCDESTGDFQEELAYGRHRRELESFVEDHFATHLVVRLPALFGHGLRKNFIFDLLNPVPSMLRSDRHADLIRQLDAPFAALVSELYSLDPVTGMRKLDRSALDSSHQRASLELAVEHLGFSATRFHHPETTYQYYEINRLWRDITIALDGGLSHIHLVSEPLTAARIYRHLIGRDMPQTDARLHREDMHTRHAGLWGKAGPYQYDAAATLDRLAAFHADERLPA